jgi:hypothetical protein
VRGLAKPAIPARYWYIAVTRLRGKDLTAVISMDDLHLLERLAQEEMDRIDLEDARAALKEAEEKGTIPLRDLMRELGD